MVTAIEYKALYPRRVWSARAQQVRDFQQRWETQMRFVDRSRCVWCEVSPMGHLCNCLDKVKA